MNIINGLIWWGRIDRDLILIGCVDSLVVTLLISPIAIYLIRHSFNLEEMNQILQKEIEEKQKAKEALKVSEEQYQLLFNSINEVVFSIDINYTITSISPSMEKYLGYMKEDFIGNYLYDLKILPKIYIEKALSQISRVLQGEILESEEYEFFTKDGRIVCAEVSGAPIIINEKIVGMISVARDITLRKQSEAALRESEQRMRLALEGTDQGLWNFDLLTKKVTYSENWQKILGYGPEESRFDYEWWINQIHPESQTNFEKALLDYMSGHAKYLEWEYQIRNKSGEWQWVQAFGIFSETDKTGFPIKMIGTHRNITAHKKVENALRDANIIIENSRVVLFRWKAAEGWPVVMVSQNVIQFGYSQEELLSGAVPFSSMVHPEDLDRVAQEVQEYSSEGIAQFHQEYRIVNKDGRVHWIDNRTVVERDIAGRVVGYQGVVIDVTERKRAEEALREGEERLRLAITAANQGLYDLNVQTGEAKVSPEYATMLGYDPATFHETNAAWIDRLHPDDHERVAATYSDYVAGKLPHYQVEFRLRTASGDWKWILSLGKLISRDAAGQPLRMLGTHTDIAQRKRAEEEKRNLEARLMRAEKMESLGILAGGVAHDLNNVLGIVVGYAELLLLKESKSSANRPQLEEIMKGGQKAAAIVQDLLTLARRGVPGRDVLNLNKVIADCQRSPEFKQLSSLYSFLQIRIELEPDLLNISGSSVHLGKTIFNLISNASEAMQKGGIMTIKTANQYLDKPIHGYDEIREGDYVVLSVSDTGEGIHETDIKRIFEPFYTKKVMGRSGTGLGLSVVWGTVKDHNGYINVESEEGKGSTFTLYFPVTRKELSAEHPAVSISEYMGKGESILIVDDVKEQRDLASVMLKELNYSVSSVKSGEEAVAYLKEHKADLLVLDMIMDPGIDGLDTYMSVLEIRPKQKAIIVSGFSESDRVKAAQALGAGAYVRKPYVIEKLGLAVKKELDRST